MTMLDIATLHVVLSCTLGFMAIVMWLLRQLHPDETALPIWAAGNLCCSIGIITVIRQAYVQDITSLVIPNFMTVSGCALFWLGIRAFLGLRLPWFFISIVLGLFAVVELYALYVHPLMWARLTNESVAIAFMAILILIDIIPQARRHKSFNLQFIVAVHFVHATAFLTRGVYALTSRPTSDYLSISNFIPIGTALEALLATFAVNVCFLLLTSRRLQERLDKLATIDELTGLFNRRAFNKMALDELTRISRRNEPSALLLIDFDNFKTINDQYGHAGGDALLEAFGKLLQNNTRSGDISGRIGGEEFCVFLPSTDKEEAFSIAERIRLCFSQGIHLANGQHIATTLSIGVSIIAREQTLEWALQQSDRALYTAKNSGRNRVHSTLSIMNSSVLAF